MVVTCENVLGDGEACLQDFVVVVCTKIMVESVALLGGVYE